MVEYFGGVPAAGCVAHACTAWGGRARPWPRRAEPVVLLALADDLSKQRGRPPVGYVLVVRDVVAVLHEALDGLLLCHHLADGATLLVLPDVGPQAVGVRHLELARPGSENLHHSSQATAAEC